ncbi:MAG: flagellar assembly protein FliH [Gammaproteobacteria bacterium]
MSERIHRDAATAAAAQVYSLPSVDGPIIGRRVSEKEKVETERAQFAKGYEDGLAAARREIEGQLAKLRSRMAQLDAIMGSLARPFEELDAEVEQQLTLLALTVGKQMVRRELRTDPAQVIGVIRECVGRLPAAARDVRVHLHPEDAAVVRELLATPGTDRAWNIVEDPALTRGGCIVRTDVSQIDARLDSRLNAVVAAAFGDERAPGARAEANAGKDS